MEMIAQSAELMVSILCTIRAEGGDGGVGGPYLC